MLKKIKSAVPALVLLAPALVLAQTPGDGTLGGVVATIGQILTALIPVVMTLALLYFFWGLAKYILSAGDAEKASEGKSIMIYGIIALFVMVAVWGLTGLLSKSVLGTDTGTAPNSNTLIPR